MGRRKWTADQKFAIVLQGIRGTSTIAELCREHGISSATYYKWMSKYGGMELSGTRRLKELENENRRLKQMYADLSLENAALKDVISKKL